MKAVVVDLFRRSRGVYGGQLREMWSPISIRSCRSIRGDDFAQAAERDASWQCGARPKAHVRRRKASDLDEVCEDFHFRRTCFKI
jgi:hypothetical protein